MELVQGLGLSVGKTFNSQLGGQTSGELFLSRTVADFEATAAALKAAGVALDAWMVETWYYFPRLAAPEWQAGTTANTLWSVLNVSDAAGAASARDFADRPLWFPSPPLPPPSPAPKEPLPPTRSYSPVRLAAARALVARRAAAVMPAYGELLKQADALATGPLPAPVTSKDFTPPSGTKRSYESAGRYDWPCTWQPAPPLTCAPAPPGPPCNASSGLPWVERDGCPNEAAIAAQDAPRWEALSAFVQTLGAAYFFSRNETFAQRGVEAVRAWLLSNATGMLPDLTFAQYVPGKNNTHTSGMIDFSYKLPGLLDCIALLAASPSWTAADGAAMQAWAAGVLRWQLESTQGCAEAAMPNNHGTWFDAQALALALFTGNGSVASAVAAATAARRFDTQIAADGSLPQETSRQDALSYTEFDIAALQSVAQLAAAAGADLWAHVTPRGATLADTLAFLAPFAVGGKPWPFSQTAPFDFSTLWSLYRRAALATGNASFEAWAAALPGNASGPTELDNLMWCWACP